MDSRVSSMGHNNHMNWGLLVLHSGHYGTINLDKFSMTLSPNLDILGGHFFDFSY